MSQNSRWYRRLSSCQFTRHPENQLRGKNGRIYQFQRELYGLTLTRCAQGFSGPVKCSTLLGSDHFSRDRNRHRVSEALQVPAPIQLPCPVVEDDLEG